MLGEIKTEMIKFLGKMAIKVKSVMALHQKYYVMRSTTYVENFMLYKVYDFFALIVLLYYYDL